MAVGLPGPRRCPLGRREGARPGRGLPPPRATHAEARGAGGALATAVTRRPSPRSRLQAGRLRGAGRLRRPRLGSARRYATLRSAARRGLGSKRQRPAISRPARQKRLPAARGDAGTPPTQQQRLRDETQATTHTPPRRRKAPAPAPTAAPQAPAAYPPGSWSTCTGPPPSLRARRRAASSCSAAGKGRPPRGWALPSPPLLPLLLLLLLPARAEAEPLSSGAAAAAAARGGPGGATRPAGRSASPMRARPRFPAPAPQHAPLPSPVDVS